MVHVERRSKKAPMDVAMLPRTQARNALSPSSLEARGKGRSHMPTSRTKSNQHKHKPKHRSVSDTSERP